MSWTAMTDVPNPIIVDAAGTAGSGYVLKAYLPGTTTTTSIAIDSSGSSPQSTITANSEGKWEVSGNEIIPFIDRKHKWGIFASAAHATENTPFYMGPFDNVPQLGSATDSIYTPAGSGAVATTVQAELRKVFRTSNFGTNNAAFAAAIIAATGKELIVDNSVTITGTHAIAVGSSLKVESGGLITDGGGGAITFNGGFICSKANQAFSGFAAGDIVFSNTIWASVKWFGATGDGSTDDTNPIKAALGSSAAVYFPDPPSYYKTTAVLKIADGNARILKGASRFTTKIENASSNVFDLGGADDAGFFYMEELHIKSETGGGHIFVPAVTFAMGEISRCKIEQANPGKAIWYQTVGYCGGMLVYNCHLVAASFGTMTINPWYMLSSEIVNGLTIRDCRCDHSRDGFQFFRIDTTSAGSYNSQCLFDGVTFELTYGGDIYLGGHKGSEIRNCGTYDLATAQDGHGIHIGRSAGNLRSSRCKVSRRVKHPTTGYSIGASIQDINLESAGADNCILESCFNSTTDLKIDFGNSKTLVIDRESNSAATLLNDDNVTCIDISGDYEGVVAPSFRHTIGTASRELTIASGSITPTHLYHTIDTEGNAATDDLDTIVGTNMREGDIITLRSITNARVPTIKDGTGNLSLAGDFALSDDKDVIQLLWNGSAFQEVTRSNNS